jgi:4-hydroxy-tetrahydrodipicolinate synthase
LGLAENTVRLPLVNVDEDLAKRLHNFTNKIAAM